MDPSLIQTPPGGWGALAIVTSGVAAAGITQIGIYLRARRRSRDTASRLGSASADKAYDLLADIMNARINELRTELHETRDELRETKASLDEKTEEWMIATRAHEDCQRRLSILERTVAELKRRSDSGG